MINYIKSLALMALLALPLGAMLSSCSSDNDPFFTAGEDDYPVILNSDLQTSEEWKNGEPPVLKTITRKEHFIYEAIVTPAHYTTVTWFIDGQQVHEGKEIDIALALGEHTLKIVATTTKGLETSRVRKIVVTLCNDDPVAGKDIYDRLVKQGTGVKLHGDYISKVVKVKIGDQTIDVTYNADEDCIEYTVPELPDGVYTLQLVDAEGYVFDAGTIELNANPVYPDPTGEVTLWEGSYDVTWGTPFDGLQFELIKHIQVGTVVRAYVTGNGQGCLATKWWRNLETGTSDDDTGRGDTPIDGDMVLECTISQLSIDLLNQQEGFYVVGNGYTIKKITVETVKEVSLWEGSFDVTWGTPFDGLQFELINHIKIGSIVRAYVTGNGQGCLATKWWRNLETGTSDDDTGRGDTPIDGDMVLECTISQLSIDLLNQQEGFYVVGNGYTIKKITVE